MILPNENTILPNEKLILPNEFFFLEHKSLCRILLLKTNHTDELDVVIIEDVVDVITVEEEVTISLAAEFANEVIVEVFDVLVLVLSKKL